MRLTLRTLLAYRDRVLKPSELADMHARVQQSAMAGNLLKRIEALSHRANILAPPIEGKGLGADANSIAEYLDDALKGEKVPELERICLESDVQLSELTQCHHLLSTALSTSVEVPPALRERIMAWGDRTVREKALSKRTGDLAAAAGLHLPTTRKTPALQEGKSRFRTDGAHAPRTNGKGGEVSSTSETRDGRSAAETLADREPRSKRLVTAQPVEAPMVASGGDSIRPTGLDLEGAHLAHEVPEYLRGRSHDGWRGPLAIGALVAVLLLLVWQSVGSWQTVQQLFVSRPLPNAATSEAANSNPVVNSHSAVVSPKSDRSATATALAPLDTSSKPVRDPVAIVPAAPGAIGAGALVEASADHASTTAPLSSTLNPPVASDAPIANTVAAATDALIPHAAQWLPTDALAMQSVLFVQTSNGTPLHRVQAAERLPSGSHLFIPLANRPTLDLAQGPRWTVCGPTHMAVFLPETGTQAPPSIDLFLGRAVITSGAIGSSVSIRTPDSEVLLSLANASSQIAIELNYIAIAHGPVNDRTANPPIMTISMLQGAASVLPQGTGEPFNLAAGQEIFVNRNQITNVQSPELPLWIESTSDRPVDQLAAEDMQRQLTDRETSSATLMKLATNRRPETRAMAAQTLALLGNWDWIVAEKNTLSDRRDRSYWNPLLDQTRQAIAAHPENASALRAALISQDANAGPYRAEMWIGLPQAQLAGDGLARLVDLLDSEILLDRILAIYQLQRLTGKDLGYQAGEINRASIQQWNRELASGRIQLQPLNSAP